MKRSGTSTLLTCIGAIGVITTAALGITATPKAMRLLDKVEKEKGEKLTVKETVLTAAPVYVPTIISGVATIACIFGANVLNKRQQATLMSAYALLNNSYKEYRDKVEELCGEGTDERIKHELAVERYSENELDTPEGDEVLFLDFNTLDYFYARMDDVIQKATMDDGLECYIVSTPSSRF